MNVLANNYEIIKEIGRGGTGSVYLAHDKKLERQVAVKILELDSNLDKSLVDEMEKRFEKEAKAIARLNHPNILDIYDFGQENGKHFMVIELLKGESLLNQINRIKSLPLEKIIDIGLQLCSAVSYAHSQGVIHRDIKPANIMLLENDKVKLTDFGIAQVNNDKLGLTQAGSILGSILYIPPEQLVDSHKVDKRADVYSLGVTLFQLFTGRLPFEGNSVAEVVTKILNQDIPTMSSFKKDIPEPLDRIILKSIKKEPDERYQNIDDLSSALKDIRDYLKNNINLDSNMSKNYKSESIKKNKIDYSNKKNTKTLLFFIPLLLVILSLIIYFIVPSKKNQNKLETKTDIHIKVTPTPISTIKPVVKNQIKEYKKILVKPKQKILPKLNINSNKKIKSTNNYIKKHIITPVLTRKNIISAKSIAPVIKKMPITNKPVKKVIAQTKKSIGEGY